MYSCRLRKSAADLKKVVFKHWKEVDVDGNIILEWEGVVWIHLAQNRDQWLALVNTVMNLRIP
jgi:hypothetical protein